MSKTASVIFLLFLLTGPLVTRVLTSSITVVEAEVSDRNHDGFEDLVFRIRNTEGYGIAGIPVNITTVNSEVLFTGETNESGYCVFYTMPSGNYSWKTSSGAPNNGKLNISTKQYSAFSEKEVVTIQFLLLTWMGNLTDKTRTFYENFSRYVGYDLYKHPFPSPSGKNLSIFSRDLVQWYEGLQHCIINNISIPEVSHLLQKILGVSREICLRIYEDSIQLDDLNNVTEVKLLFIGQTDDPDFINYTVAYYRDNASLKQHTILRMSTSNEKAITSLSGIFTSSFDPFIEFSPFNNAGWKFGAQSNNLLVDVCQGLDITKNILEFVTDTLKLVQLFSDVAADLTCVLGTAQTALAGYILGLMCFLELTYRYPSITEWLNALLTGDLLAISLTIGAIAGFALGAYCTWLIIVGASSSAIPVIGLAIAAITTIIVALLDRTDYESWLNDVRGTLGNSLTEMLKLRRALHRVNTTLVKHSAQKYKEAADLLGQFAVASSYTNDFFLNASIELSEFGEKEKQLGIAVEETRPVLEDLIDDYLHWEGDNGIITGHLEGFNSTSANYTNAVCSINTAGIFHPFKGYQTKKITHGNLNPSPQFKTQESYANWANEPPTENDPEGNQFSVSYNGDTNNFTYNPEPPYFSEENVKNITRNGVLETFYQYKFFFDEGTTVYDFPDILKIARWGLPVEDLLVEWQNHLKEKYEADVKPRLQNISSLVELLAPDNEPPKTELYISDIAFPDPIWSRLELLVGIVHVDSSTMFALTAVDSHSGVAATSYRIFNSTYGTEWKTIVGPNDHTFSFTFPKSLENGEYKIEFNSTDHAGNAEAPKISAVVKVLGTWNWTFPGLILPPPRFVVDRAKLGLTPASVSSTVVAGDNFTTTLVVSELTGDVDLENVVLAGSNLTDGNNGIISSDCWSFSNDTFTVPKGESVYVTTTLTVPENKKSGKYYGIIKAKSSDGTAFVLANITVSLPYGPKAEFTITSETANAGESVKFDASDSLPGFNGTHTMPITEYRWDFWDGNKMITATPIAHHSFNTAGNYYVTLTVFAPGATPETDSIIHKVTVTSAPVGGYSFSIRVHTTTKPLMLYFATVAIFAAVFTLLKRKTRRGSKPLEQTL